jgi:hypothetical protein
MGRHVRYHTVNSNSITDIVDNGPYWKRSVIDFVSYVLLLEAASSSNTLAQWTALQY